MESSTRPAAEDDVAVLLDIDARASAFPWTPGQFQCSIAVSDDREQGLVIECGASVVGFVIFNLVLDDGNIHNIAVHPDYHRQGLASTLLLQVFELMKQASGERCLLDVRRSNMAAVELYTHLGFQVDGVRKNYYRGSGGREDALLMSKLL